LSLNISVASETEADYLCWVFAVAGVPVEGEDDLALACREVVGRYLFVEVLPEGQIHVLQLSTTHSFAVPLGVTGRLGNRFRDDQADFNKPCPADYIAVTDNSDPEDPRYFACDLQQKAELHLHPAEQLRVLRAEAERFEV
jgi:hypothetical protein